MSNQDDESKNKDSILPSYQFFSHDLNYNYFTEPATSADAPHAVSPAPALPVVSTPTVSNFVQDVPSVPYTPSSIDFLAPLSAPAATPAPVVKAEPERVAYSLNDDEPELTFEQRVAAMEQEIARANAASAAAQAAADAIEQAAAVKAAAELGAAQPISPVPTFSRFPDMEPIPEQYLQAPAPAPAETGTQSGEKWNAYVAPSCAPDVFSHDFNFNRSLLKIFWRIDIDHNNRVSKNELAIALQDNWFQGDEKVLARLLFDMYEEISPEAIFCDAGLSVNNILSFAPFSAMVSEQLDVITPPEPTKQPDRNFAAKKKTKSSQSLRNMFSKGGRPFSG